MTASLRHGAEVEARSMRRVDRLVHRVLRGILEGFCRVYWRLEVQGRDRLPVAGPFILAPVHRSNVDFAIAGAAVPRVMRFMAKNSVWKYPRIGRFLERMGTFPVDRSRADRGALRNCERSLAQGDPVVMFPEGRRREGDDVVDLLEGPAWVACRNRVPIVPVGLGGTDRAMPIGARFIRPVRIRVVIGEPIFPDVPVEGRVPRGAVAELTEQLRIAVQQRYEEARGA